MRISAGNWGRNPISRSIPLIRPLVQGGGQWGHRDCGCGRRLHRAIAFGLRDSVSAQGIEFSYPGRADVKWMRRLSGKNRTEFSPRVPIDSQIFPFCPLIRVISYLRNCSGTRFFKFGPIRFHCVPFLLFLAFGQAMPLRLSADTSRGAVRPAQASSTIDRTHDHLLSKSKGLGKRQMLSGFPNAIALVGCRSLLPLCSVKNIISASQGMECVPCYDSTTHLQGLTMGECQ